MNKIITRFGFLLAMIVAVPLAVVAQVVVTGTVIDGELNEPIMGANVVFVNSQNRNVKGTVTDMDGNFSIQAPDAKGLTFQVSYIGMQSYRVKFNGQTKIDVTLQPDSKLTLSNVVVQGSRRDAMGVGRLEQTGSVQALKLDEIIESTPVSTIEDALQGQIAGLDITMGGDPGAKNSMQIRGANTLNGDANPLIVVDGVPYDTEIADDFSFATANQEDFGALLNIPPENIESVEVHKDASATAIYGSKGSNGVILVTTKKGSTGKTKFTFSTKWTFKKEPSSIPLLNGKQYTSLLQDALWNAANAKGITSAQNDMNLLLNDEINYNTAYKYYDEYNVNTDWLDAVRQNAMISDNNFSMSGGGEKATYRFSLGYYDEQGTTRGTGLDRLQTQLKVTYNFSDRLRVHTDFSFTGTNKEANVLDNARSIAQSKMPNESPYWIDDITKQPTDKYFVQKEDFQGAYNKTYNPVAMVDLGFNKTKIREEKMTITADYDFPFHLRFTGWVSLRMNTNKNTKFLPQEAIGVLWTDANANRATDATSDSYSLQTEMKFLYNNVLKDKHGLVGTLIMRTNQSSSSNTSSITYGNASAALTDPIIGSTVASAGSGESEKRSISLIGQAVYTFDQRYSLKATINYEGNSAMGRNNRFGSYPAFGFAWNIDKEHFIPQAWKDNWLTEAKARISIGWTGKAPSGAAYYFGAYKSLGTYVDMPAIYPDRMQLDNLKWETTREWDFGLDLRLFNKLGITFDYYDKDTRDLLLADTQIPVTTGFAKVKYVNSGRLSNKGFELRFDYDVYKGKPWTIKVNGNCSRNINKVEELPKTYKAENYTFGNGNYAWRLEEGKPIGAFYGYRYLGVYQNVDDTYAKGSDGKVMYDYNGNAIVMQNGNNNSGKVYPGDAKYEDVNKDGVINEQDIVYLGNANPKLIFGGGFTVIWKNLSLTTLFYGRLGQKVINSARMNLENMYGKNNQSTAVLHRWRAEGDQTEIPRALYGMGYNYLGSDRFVEDATYVRLKTLTLSYNVPKEFLSKLHLGVTRCNIFATGYELFTFTSYTGQDPEVGMPTAKKLVMDGSTTPITKRYVFGMTVNF